jgi:hypothetical protein
VVWTIGIQFPSGRGNISLDTSSGINPVSYSLCSVCSLGPAQCPIHCVLCVLWGLPSVLATVCRVFFGAHSVSYPLCSVCSLGPVQCPIHYVPCVLWGPLSVLSTMSRMFFGAHSVSYPLCAVCSLRPAQCSSHCVPCVLFFRVQRQESDPDKLSPVTNEK